MMDTAYIDKLVDMSLIAKIFKSAIFKISDVG